MTSELLARAATLFDDIVPQLLQRWRVPGAAVAVVHRNSHWANGYGITNLEHPLPVDSRTLFQIGSVTKTFTATIAMQDIEAGRLQLDTRVQSILPDFALADASAAAAITVRHLLTHRAGFFGDYLLVHGAGLIGGRSIADGVAALRDASQILPPGTVSSYNNAGFTILGRLSEVVNEQPWVELLHERILGPAGMRHSYTSADEVVTHRVAVGHAGRHVVRGRTWQAGWELSGWDLPAGGLISCADDVALWLQIQLNGGNGVIGVGTVAAMHEAEVPFGNVADEIGLCWMRRTVDGELLIGHGGQTIGYETDVGVLPELGIGFALMTNAVAAGSAFNRSLRRALLRELAGIDDAPPQPVIGAATDGLTGDYDLPFWRFNVVADSDRSRLTLTAVPYDDGRSWSPPPPLPLTAAMYGTDVAVIVEPPAAAGGCIEFGRDDSDATWLRFGGRVGLRSRQ